MNDLLIPIGKIDGNFAYADFSGDSHLLVLGTTGSGKSFFINEIMSSIISLNNPGFLSFAIYNSTGLDYNEYSSSPYVFEKICKTQEEGHLLLNRIIEINKQRIKLFQDSKVNSIIKYNEFAKNNNKKEMPQLFVILDDGYELLDTYSEKEALYSILNTANTGIHLILSTSMTGEIEKDDQIKMNMTGVIILDMTSKLDYSKFVHTKIDVEPLLYKEFVYMNQKGQTKIVNRIDREDEE